MELRYSSLNPTQSEWTSTTACSMAMLGNREDALVASARDLSDNELQNIAVLITQRQVVARKLLATPDAYSDAREVISNTMDYINDELRKLLAL